MIIMNIMRAYVCMNSLRLSPVSYVMPIYDEGTCPLNLASSYVTQLLDVTTPNPRMLGKFKSLDSKLWPWVKLASHRNLHDHN